MTCLIERVLGRDKVTYFYVGDIFCICLGTMYADFQEKIFLEISGKKFQTFHCINVTTMKSLELFPRNILEEFFLKIGLEPRCIQRTTPTQKNVTSSLLRSELWSPSKSLKYFTNRVVRFSPPCVDILL